MYKLKSESLIMDKENMVVEEVSKNLVMEYNDFCLSKIQLDMDAVVAGVVNKVMEEVNKK